MSQFTKHWAHPIVAGAPFFEPEERIRVLDELNWRLEAALVPIFPDLAEAIEVCLKTIQPFTGDIGLPEAPFRLNDKNVDKFRWSDLRKRWINLGFAILRYHREERNSSLFFEWAERLERVIYIGPELQARLCYEKCLFAFGRMDDLAARAAIAKWPSDDHDPIWSLRLASIVAELGELREATRLTQTALQQIRTQAKGPEDIRSLSREGWAILFVQGLSFHRQLTGQSLLQDHRGRWEYLARFRCDPRADLDHFDTQFENEPPQVIPTVSSKPGFQPGRSIQTFRYPGGVGLDLLPAHQYMRLTEEAPYPPSLGNISLSEKRLETVAQWFMEHDPARTFTLLCRLHSKKLIEEYLTRYRVAAIPMAVVNEFIEISLNAISHAERRVLTPDDSSDAGTVGMRAKSRLEAGIELLARVSIRLSSAAATQLLSRAIELYRSPVVQNDLSLPSVVGQLFETILRAMTPEDLGNHLTELMALPVPGSPEFPVAHPEMWPDFLALLPTSILSQLRRQAPTVWRRRIEALLDSLNSSALGVRGRIALRLEQLRSYGCLTTREIRSFATRLWATTDPTTLLPAIQPLRRASFLSLPEPRAGLASERVRAYLNGGDIIRFGTRTIGPDGRDHWHFTPYADPDGFLIDWLSASAATPAQFLNTTQQYLKWNLTEITTLFQKLRRWWEEEGIPLLAPEVAAFPLAESMIAEPLRQRIQRILDVMRLSV
jgi:hypothetical protein